MAAMKLARGWPRASAEVAALSFVAPPKGAVVEMSPHEVVLTAAI